MADNSLAANQLKAVKQKLDASIKARTALEDDFKQQSSMLIQFIAKLSQASKGIDLELDNKLANLRAQLLKSVPLTKIEEQIANITKLLTQVSTRNEANIRQLKGQFLNAGKDLQKIQGLPDTLRRNLRALLSESQETKESVIQYVPLLSQLVSLYEEALKAKYSETNSDETEKDATDVLAKVIADGDTVKAFENILNRLHLSSQLTKQLLLLKQKVKPPVTQQSLVDCCFEAFDLVMENFRHERSTAESFLSTLSETLSTVQSAVKNTLDKNADAYGKNSQLSEQLHSQINGMTESVQTASSLTDIKEDIHQKLQQIAETLSEKTDLERYYQHDLEQELQLMAEKISLLEQQSEQFEARLQEQHKKSLQDALTRLGNRAAFDEYFVQQMARFHQNKQKLALVVMDLDDFKQINDTYGHSAGDKTLRAIAQTMQKCVTPDVFLGRYGGEEFVMVFQNIDQRKLLAILNKIRISVEKLPFKFKNKVVSITVSIGATHVTSQDNIHTAFERADDGLYQAKNQGKNNVVYL